MIKQIMQFVSVQIAIKHNFSLLLNDDYRKTKVRRINQREYNIANRVNSKKRTTTIKMLRMSNCLCNPTAYAQGHIKVKQLVLSAN